MCACHFLLNHLQIVFAQNSMQNILYPIHAKQQYPICIELWQTLQVWEVKGSIGISHFMVHHFIVLYRYSFFKKIATLHCINLLVPSPIAFANFISQCHILVIFEIFHTFFFFYYICMVTFQRRQWHPTPVLLSRKSHGCRSLVGCSPWGR